MYMVYKIIDLILKKNKKNTLTAWPSGMSLVACSAAHSSAEGDRQAEGEDCRNDACVGGVELG